MLFLWMIRMVAPFLLVIFLRLKIMSIPIIIKTIRIRTRSETPSKNIIRDWMILKIKWKFWVKWVVVVVRGVGRICWVWFRIYRIIWGRNLMISWTHLEMTFWTKSKNWRIVIIYSKRILTWSINFAISRGALLRIFRSKLMSLRMVNAAKSTLTKSQTSWGKWLSLWTVKKWLQTTLSPPAAPMSPTKISLGGTQLPIWLKSRRLIFRGFLRNWKGFRMLKRVFWWFNRS